MGYVHRFANEDGSLDRLLLAYTVHTQRRERLTKFLLNNAIQFFLELIAKHVHSFSKLLLSDQGLEVYLLLTISFLEFESYFNGEITV